MLIDFNTDVLHRWYSIDEVLPYPQYTAGTNDDDTSTTRNPVDSTSNPILALNFDIVNEYGFGLKRGYYEIATNSDLSILMFVESGVIKAKIPVIKQERISEYGTNYEWEEDKRPNSVKATLKEGETIASKKIYKVEYSKKEQKRRAKKYKKGEDPSCYFHSKVYMEYDRELDLYKIIWEKYNTRLIGVIKL